MRSFFVSCVESLIEWEAERNRRAMKRWKGRKRSNGSSKMRKLSGATLDNSSGLTSNESDSRDLLITFRLRNLKVCRPLLVMGAQHLRWICKISIFHQVGTVGSDQLEREKSICDKSLGVRTQQKGNYPSTWIEKDSDLFGGHEMLPIEDSCLVLLLCNKQN